MTPCFLPVFSMTSGVAMPCSALPSPAVHCHLLIPYRHILYYTHIPDPSFQPICPSSRAP